MGNYYAGMMNNTGGYGELKHHGILGQKWGVRRWQNADGSLTAAGRERYGVSGDDRKSIVELAKKGNSGRRDLANHPKVQQAADAIKNEHLAFKRLSRQRDSILDKIPDKLFYNDKWINGDDPRAVEYRKINKEYNKAFDAYRAAAKKEANRLVGVEGLKMVNKNEVNMWNSFNVKDQVTNAIMSRDFYQDYDMDTFYDPKKLSKSITNWFGSNRISDLKKDMEHKHASNFDEYLESISMNPDYVRLELDNQSHEIKNRLTDSYQKLSKDAEETPERYISTESLERRLASKSDDYKYIRNIVDNAYDITGYRKFYSDYETARERRNNSAFGAFENSKSNKNFRDAYGKLMRVSKDLEDLSLTAAFDYIEKLPKSDQDAYKAYLYCLMGYDW